MSIREEITALQARIAKAQSERDTWQGSGMQEKYLEACSLVEALDLQLERLRQEGLRTFARNRASVGALLTPRPVGAAFSLAFSGRQYEYAGTHYDCLAEPLDSANPPPGSAQVSALPGQSAPPATD